MPRPHPSVCNAKSLVSGFLGGCFFSGLLFAFTRVETPAASIRVPVQHIISADTSVNPVGVREVEIKTTEPTKVNPVGVREVEIKTTEPTKALAAVPKIGPCSGYKSETPVRAAVSTSAEQRFGIVPDSCDFDSGVFDGIYASGHWGFSPSRHCAEILQPKYYYEYGEEKRSGFNRASLSGRGSWLFATINSLSFLTKAIEKHNIKTVLDIPCGDVNWQFQSWEMDSLDFYVGLDVSRKAIELDTSKFAHHMNKKFAGWDIAKCILPKLKSPTTGQVQPFDMIHVRDVIQHMEQEAGVNALCNVVHSGAKWIMITTYDGGANPNLTLSNFKKGHPIFYQVNIEKAPYNFPKSKDCIRTHKIIELDFTCLWNIANELGDFKEKCAREGRFGRPGTNAADYFAGNVDAVVHSPPLRYGVVPERCDFDSSVFDGIYATGQWGFSSSRDRTELLHPKYYYEYGDENRSGFLRASLSGRSSWLSAAKDSLSFLGKVILEHDIKTILDVGCGDVNWNFQSWEMDSLDFYVGLDVSRKAIEVDRKRHEHHINKRFLGWDVSKCTLPQLQSRTTGQVKPFDMIHMRDAIQLMDQETGINALCNVVNSGATWFMSTTNTGATTEVSDFLDVQVNLEKPPYSFPTCVKTHSTCLWNIEKDLGQYRQKCQREGRFNR